MPVIKKPDDASPVFSLRAQVMIGGPLVHQLVELKQKTLQRRLRTGKDGATRSSAPRPSCD